LKQKAKKVTSGRRQKAKVLGKYFLSPSRRSKAKVDVSFLFNYNLRQSPRPHLSNQRIRHKPSAARQRFVTQKVLLGLLTVLTQLNV
jgi:hypothetical protein